jgi:hypothetical protein
MENKDILKKLETIYDVLDCCYTSYDYIDLEIGDTIMANYKVSHYIDNNKIYLRARRYKILTHLYNKEIKDFKNFLDFAIHKRVNILDLTYQLTTINSLSNSLINYINLVFQEALEVIKFLKFLEKNNNNYDI